MTAPNNPARPSRQALIEEEQRQRQALSTLSPHAPAAPVSEPALSLNPPSGGQSIGQDFRPDLNLPPHDFEAEGDWTALDAQRLKSIHEALSAHRAMLYAALSRQDNQLVLNPASLQPVTDALKLGIARAEHLIAEIEAGLD